jgi:glycosyltransferase involved in cell wall biosynthesis
MGLSILSVAYPFAPVGDDAVGGAEQVLAQLDAALVRAGHRSIVVACEGSNPAGILVATPRAEGAITETVRARAHAAHRCATEHALRRWPVDLVHMHGIDFHAYLPPPGPPVLVTLHLPPEWYPPEIFHPERPGTFLHCVSAAQRARCPAGARLLPDVQNGVALDALDARHAKRRFALALGRICPEKGFHIALDAARRAGVPLLLAGQTFPYEAHETYFAREIAPRLDRSRRFIGPLGLVRKRRLLSAARCLLLPSLAPETSSLVAMEALACGTPVIAFPSGALPDIVEHGRTGFIVEDQREMAEAIDAASRIRPEACRAAARERFSLERTVERYFALYRQLAGSGPAELDPAEPATRPSAETRA